MCRQILPFLLLMLWTGQIGSQADTALHDLEAAFISRYIYSEKNVAPKCPLTKLQQVKI